ncbi:unnamed protein product [Spirodela intermedia]|uniref:Hexosyltransferase n=1 Tax=Spirodela intermedia TaxID=51605 RepID=A0A7I8JAV9_SPIIN|nr:unnamed protein product [Spirodela intermedia]CAA6667348.1 unnamed protein product [Spirodela intermedia]
MRRRAVDPRRPSRRRFVGWIWFLLVVSAVAGLTLVAVRRNQVEKLEPPFREVNATEITAQYQDFNLTDELLSSTSFARQLADQMTLAKAYLVIAKEHHNLKFAWDLSSQIRNSQRLLAQAALRGKPVTQDEAGPMITSLSQLIYKAQDIHYDLATAITTLKVHAQAMEDRLTAAMVQSAEFGRLAAQGLPRSIHCLTIKLTEDWFGDPKLQKLEEDQKNSPRLVDNSLYHFCIFSDNVLAASVVVNSTVSNADHPRQLVFHVVTSPVSFRAMKAWFLTSSFGGSTVEVLSTEEFPWLRKLRRDMDMASLLSHLRFYLPEIAPSLEKVVFLEDDVVVQKDLTALFSLDLHGNVNGAVETCLEAFHRYHRYVNFSSPIISSEFDPEACGWAFGMNVFDLMAWKKADLTARYHHWLRQNSGGYLWTGGGTLPPGLLTFYGSTEPLDRRWHVLGLGFDPEIDGRLIETAAVIHFNGNMKPWLGSAITRYLPLWERYVNHTRLHLHGC